MSSLRHPNIVQYKGSEMVIVFGIFLFYLYNFIMIGGARYVEYGSKLYVHGQETITNVVTCNHKTKVTKETIIFIKKVNRLNV